MCRVVSSCTGITSVDLRRPETPPSYSRLRPAGMMSTGRSGLVHVSEQCVRGLLGLAQESPVPKLAPLMPSDDCLAVVYRGLTAVKGKGDLPTYFLQRADVGTALPPDQARTRDPDMMIAELRGDNSSNTFSRRFSASVAASTGAPHDSDAAAPSAAYVIRSDQQSWHANADSELGVNASPIGTPSRMATSEQDAEGDEAVAAATIRVGAEVSAATAAQRVASQGLAIDSMTPPDSSSQEFDVPALPESSPGISAVERICRRAAELSEAVRSVPYEDCSASPGAGRALADYFSSTQAARVSPEQEISRTGARRASLGNAATSAALQRRASACVNPTPPFATTRSDEVIKVGLSAFDASVTSNRGSGTVPQEAAAPFAIPRRLSLIARHATSNVTCQQPACRGSVVSDTDRIVCASAVPTLASSVSVFPAYAIGGTRSGQASSAGPAESREAKSATEKTRQLIRDPTSGQRDSCVAVDGDESASRPVRVSFVMDNVPRGPEKEQECTTTQPGPAQDIVLAVGSPSRKMRRTGSMSAGAAIAGATTPSSASWLHRMFDSVSQLWSGFEDDDTELAAQRALFLHVLTTTASVYPLWIMSWVVVVAGYATLSVNTVNAIRCVGFTLLPLGLFFALAITARIMCWKYGVSVRWSPTAMRVALWSLTCIHVCILGVILWVASGPETVALLVPAASAAGSEPTTSLDSTSQGPFEGQLLTAVVAIAYVQHVAHSRLPFLHTCMFAAATLMVSLCLVVPRLVLQVTGGALPSSVIGSSVFAIFLGLAGNALTIIVSAFVWEGRCRTQLLSTSATSAARAAATSLLNNLMPPSIVADMVAGREVRPALARNVVILVSHELCQCRNHLAIPRASLTPALYHPSQHADIVGFTALSATLPPAQLMVHLNSIFR